MQSLSLNHTRHEYIVGMLGKQSTLHNTDNVHNMVAKINKPHLKCHFFIFKQYSGSRQKIKINRSFYVLKPEPVGCLG